jgi:peptidoglycan hydrolase-like protein with peptidoglycan-binding domain
LLRAIIASKAKAQGANATNGAATAADPAPQDPIAKLIAPSQRVTAIQRALSDFGYGQIKPTGQFDPETKTAIEKFERDRKLPIDGQISDRVVRELAATTGRPLE